MGSYWSECSWTGYRQPRSSNWLTILGNENVELLGGVAPIGEQLRSDVNLIEIKDGGLILRASKLPALGDLRTGGIPEGYRDVARLMRPIRYEGYEFGVIKLPFATDRAGDLTETLKWIRRFD